MRRFSVLARTTEAAPATVPAPGTAPALEGSPAGVAPPVLVVTGPVGVGKTTVGTAISGILGQRGTGHALIDLDELRYAYPRPGDDPFHAGLGLANLASIWPNYQRAGAGCLILPTVVESREHTGQIAAAIPGSAVFVVRLHAPLIVIRERLQLREQGTELTWHLQRTAELIDVYERSQPEDVLVDTENRTVPDLATQILALWLPDRS